MRPDPRDIRFLLAVAEHGTFMSAAKAENISQPALSSRIARLERQLGVRLVERGRHGAVLNKYGELVLRHARAVDTILDRIVEEVELEQRGFVGPLVIGCTPVAATQLVPKAISQMGKSGEHIMISIHEEEDEPLLEKLLGGEIEIALGGIGSRAQHANIVQEKLADFQIQAVVGKASSIWTEKSATLEKLADQQWALPAKGGIFREQIEAAFLNSGTPFPRTFWSCSGIISLKGLIQNTDCISLMPSHAFALEAGAGVIRGVKLDGLHIDRSVAIMRLKHANLSPLAGRFIEALHKVAQRLT